MATDRRRINGPPAETTSPIYTSHITGKPIAARPTRTRAPDELRKIFLSTSLTPSASGSAYLELSPPPPPPKTPPPHTNPLLPSSTTPKLTCTIHGPKPLPRSAPFTPHLLLTTHVKLAPFASRTPRRRGYVRDALERDLGAHLETALRGVVIGERWPKSGVEVVITVLEGEEEAWWGDELESGAGGRGWGTMGLLAACITVASAALVEAGIDCVDLVTGGVAALVSSSSSLFPSASRTTIVILDPSPIEHPPSGPSSILAACVVGYLASRDEITEVWIKGDVDGVGADADDLVEGAVRAAVAARGVLSEVVREGVKGRFLGGAVRGIGDGVGDEDGDSAGAGEADVKMSG